MISIKKNIHNENSHAELDSASHKTLKRVQGDIIIIVFFVLVLLSSCLRLDDNLYNLSDKITEYKLDNYTGEQDFILDNSYHIPDSLIHRFTLSSKGPEDNSATTIQAIYIGSIYKIVTDTVIMYCHGFKFRVQI